ncbi:unnamed protein product, partial [Ectocarpus sp. 8 AP-2014]
GDVGQVLRDAPAAPCCALFPYPAGAAVGADQNIGTPGADRLRAIGPQLRAGIVLLQEETEGRRPRPGGLSRSPDGGGARAAASSVPAAASSTRCRGIGLPVS